MTSRPSKRDVWETYNTALGPARLAQVPVASGYFRPCATTLPADQLPVCTKKALRPFMNSQVSIALESNSLLPVKDLVSTLYHDVHLEAVGWRHEGRIAAARTAKSDMWGYSGFACFS